MISEVVKCVKNYCDDVDILDHNPSGDMVAEEVQGVPPGRHCRSKSFERVFKD